MSSKHPLPPLFEQAIQRLGQYRTLRDELAYEFESSVFRGKNRAMLRLAFTLHPREAGYGGTVSFTQGSVEGEARQLAAPVATGIWQELADFRLVDFALVVQELGAAVSGEVDALLNELGARAVRHALHDASFETHALPGWTSPAAPPPPKPVGDEPPELTGAENRARREQRRTQRKRRAASPRRNEARGPRRPAPGETPRGSRPAPRPPRGDKPEERG